MSKKKAPALHERRGREDISTRPPRLAGYPIKLAGDARSHRLSLAADSCVNRKYYGGDPGVGQRKTGLHTIPPSGTLRRRPGARFSLGQVLARTKSTLSALRLVRNLQRAKVRTPRHIVNSTDDSKSRNTRCMQLATNRTIEYSKSTGLSFYILNTGSLRTSLYCCHWTSTCL